VPADEEGEREFPAWIWWVAGGGGIVATYVMLLLVAFLADPEGNWKYYSVVLMVTLPVGTVLFFVAMILANLVAEAVDIGEIHVAIFKAFFLILAVNVVGLLLPYGRWVTLPVWLAGLLRLFRLDMWEAWILLVFNWGLNFLLNLFLSAMIASWVAHGG